MQSLLRVFVILCVFAGMATGMSHQYQHHAHDECAQEHSNECHDTNHASDIGHDGDHEKTPHEHKCCHAPNADRPALISLSIGNFQGRLVELLFEESLIPERPFYALDKPPLI